MCNARYPRSSPLCSATHTNYRSLPVPHQGRPEAEAAVAAASPSVAVASVSHNSRSQCGLSAPAGRGMGRGRGKCRSLPHTRGSSAAGQGSSWELGGAVQCGIIGSQASLPPTRQQVVLRLHLLKRLQTAGLVALLQRRQAACEGRTRAHQVTFKRRAQPAGLVALLQRRQAACEGRRRVYGVISSVVCSPLAW